MFEERAAEVAELFKSAVELPTGDRAGFLDERCGDDRELRAEVEALLRTQARAGQFMERPGLEVAEMLVARQNESAPEQVDDYEVISLIGKGGMGQVYLALDRRLGRRVALKLIRRGMDSEDIVRRFEHEQRLLAGLNHPNIAQLYDAGITAEGMPFFAMEYIEGKRIDEYCRERELSIPERLALFTKVCAAVQDAHQHLVVHRDIKPSNILVNAEGEPKLLDFGIAKLLDAVTNEAPEQTVTWQKMMTPEYASPEHIRGEPITTASDVYSLGVLLYELLTGNKPYRFENRAPAEIARVVTEKEASKPSAAVGGDQRSAIASPKLLRGDLDNIVLMAMRKEPQRRYPSVAQLSADIRRHVDGLPVTARRDTLGYRSSKFIRRNRLAVTAAAVVVLSIVAGLVVALWQAQQARAQRDLAERERVKAERINQFLQTMLSFSNQSVTSISPVARKKDATISEMLDRIAPRIDAELGDQPAVRAQVLRTLGSAYGSQGQYDKAEKSFREALETQLKLHGENSPETAATQLELGGVLFRQTLKSDEAIRLLEKAERFYRKLRGTAEDSPTKLALALQGIAIVRASRGESKASIQLLREAVEISAQARLPQERAVAVVIKGDLGGALIQFGETEQGESLVREAIAEFERLSSDQPWELGALFTMLGVAEIAKKHSAEALKHLLRGEQIYRQTLGDENLYLVFNLQHAARALFFANDPRTAEAKAREAVAMSERISPDNLVPRLSPLTTLGEILLASGDGKESEACFRKLLGLYEQQTAKDYSAIISAKIRLSQALFAQARFEDAERVGMEARDETRQRLGETHPFMKFTASHLAAIYEKLGKPELADQLK